MTVQTRMLTDSERSNKRVALTCQILSGAPTRYVNTRINPPRGFYGYATIWMGDAVYEVRELQYPTQILYIWESAEAQSNVNSYELGGISGTNLQSLVAILNPTILLGSLTTVNPSPCNTPGCPVSQVDLVLADGVTAQVHVNYLGVDLGSNGAIAWEIQNII